MESFEGCTIIHDDISTDIQPIAKSADLRDIFLRMENIRHLESLQQIILIEEDRVMTLDEVLTRVLDFYNRFVPFKNFVQ